MALRQRRMRVSNSGISTCCVGVLLSHLYGERSAGAKLTDFGRFFISEILDEVQYNNMCLLPDIRPISNVNIKIRTALDDQTLRCKMTLFEE